jgi:hypothetical protein
LSRWKKPGDETEIMCAETKDKLKGNKIKKYFLAESHWYVILLPDNIEGACWNDHDVRLQEFPTPTLL